MCPEAPSGQLQQFRMASRAALCFARKKRRFQDAENLRECPFLYQKQNENALLGEWPKTDLPGLQEAPEGRFATATQTEITGQALLQVRKSKHLCCRTVWHDLPAPTAVSYTHLTLPTTPYV